MLICHILLFVVMICSFAMSIIGTKPEGCVKKLRVFLVLGSVLIFIISLLGFLFSRSTAKVYRSEYDELIKNIDYNKTKIVKENDGITEIYITVNGKEHHFIFKED